MYRRVATLLAALAVAGAGPVATSTASPVFEAHAACSSATIGGKHKCLGRGEFCARRYATQYPKYGFRCTKRDANGRYHLT